MLSRLGNGEKKLERKEVRNKVFGEGFIFYP